VSDVGLFDFFNIVAVVSFLLAQYWGWRALRHLSPRGHDRFWPAILIWGASPR